MITPQNKCNEFHLEFYQWQDQENAPFQIKMEKLKPKSLGEGGRKKKPQSWERGEKRKTPNLGIQRNQGTKKLVSQDHENMWENHIGKKQKTEWQ
jgi:hypothetical protein